MLLGPVNRWDGRMPRSSPFQRAVPAPRRLAEHPKRSAGCWWWTRSGPARPYPRIRVGKRPSASGTEAASACRPGWRPTRSGWWYATTLRPCVVRAQARWLVPPRVTAIVLEPVLAERGAEPVGLTEVVRADGVGEGFAPHATDGIGHHGVMVAAGADGMDGDEIEDAPQSGSAERTDGRVQLARGTGYVLGHADLCGSSSIRTCASACGCQKPGRDAHAAFLYSLMRPSQPGSRMTLSVGGEVAGDGGLGAQRLRRCRRRSGRRPVDVGVLENLPDGGRSDGVAEPDEFAVDAPVAPGRVLPCHPHGQAAHLGGCSQASWSSLEGMWWSIVRATTPLNDSSGNGMADAPACIPVTFSSRPRSWSARSRSISTVVSRGAFGTRPLTVDAQGRGRANQRQRASGSRVAVISLLPRSQKSWV